MPLQDNREAERGCREAALELGRYSHLGQASGLSDLSFPTGMVVTSWGGAPEVKDRPLYSKWSGHHLKLVRNTDLQKAFMGFRGAGGSSLCLHNRLAQAQAGLGHFQVTS